MAEEKVSDAKEWMENFQYNTDLDYTIAYEYSKEQREDLLTAWKTVDRKIELATGFSIAFGGWLALNQDKLHIPLFWISVSVILSISAAFVSAWAWLFVSKRPMSGSVKSIMTFAEIRRNEKALIAAHTHYIAVQYRSMIQERTKLLRISAGLLALSVLVATISSIALRDPAGPKSTQSCGASP